MYIPNYWTLLQLYLAGYYSKLSDSYSNILGSYSGLFDSYSDMLNGSRPEWTDDLWGWAKEIDKFYAKQDFEGMAESVASRYKDSKQLIQGGGFPAEEHVVHTRDGYRLRVFRVPGAGPPVVLVHGLLLSSDQFLVSGRRSLAFQLADAGYDVWLPNCRGNLYSREHATLSPDDCQFWQFSWHEMGTEDLPAVVDYVLEKTNRSRLSYVGHSQGTTAAFVMLSKNVTYNDKIDTLIALAPVASLSHIMNPVLLYAAKMQKYIAILFDVFGIVEVNSNSSVTKTIARDVAGASLVTAVIYDVFLFTSYGFSFAQIDLANIQNQISHTSAGSSVFQILHFLQVIESGEFREYDYGATANVVRYGEVKPPAYPVERISCSVYLFSSDSDRASDPRDVQKLKSQLSNVVGEYRLPVTWNHLDYCWGKDAAELIYSKIKELLSSSKNSPTLLDLLQKTEHSLIDNVESRLKIPHIF